MNIPAILSLFRVARDPALCLPHTTVSTFADLPIPLSGAFRRPRGSDNEKSLETLVDIRAVILDKDNCFAVPHTDEIYPAYSDKLAALIKTYGRSNVLIVSNSSGTLSKDPLGTAANTLENNTGLTVLRHNEKKPACGDEILKYFRRQHQAHAQQGNNTGLEKQEQGREVTTPSQICVIGDRLFTDVVMANMMGAHAIWIKEGVVRDRGLVTRVEYGFEAWLRGRGWGARWPGA